LLPVSPLKENFSLLQQYARLARTGLRSRTGRHRIGHGHPSSLPVPRRSGGLSQAPLSEKGKDRAALMFFFSLL
jgi:hypothetical protein